MEFIYILMCHYASVYWIFLFAGFKRTDCFKDFVYFKTVQLKCSDFAEWEVGSGSCSITSLRERKAALPCQEIIAGARVPNQMRVTRSGKRAGGGLLNKGTGRG